VVKNNDKLMGVEENFLTGINKS